MAAIPPDPFVTIAFPKTVGRHPAGARPRILAGCETTPDRARRLGFRFGRGARTPLGLGVRAKASCGQPWQFFGTKSEPERRAHGDGSGLFRCLLAQFSSFVAYWVLRIGTAHDCDKLV
jgi:hypothetical protein